MLAQQATALSNPFILDPDSEVPLGVQLAWRLRALILSGRLAPAEALPSVRQLAASAGVNVNTVRSVYDSLQGEGLVTSRQGKGTFVAETAVPKPELEGIAVDAVRRGEASGVRPRDLAIAVMACAELLEDDRSTEAPEEAVAAPAEADTLEIRKELRRQIAQLEAELASYVRDLPPGELPTAPPWAEGHIADIEELEEIRDVLVTKLFRARKSAMDRAKRESEARRGAQKRSAEGPLTRVMSRWRDSMDK